MPYLRLTADRRGNEHTFLMHVAGPGEPARVLYWYRTAPGVRLGRSALDDTAMRWLEEQYPDIDFDWREILDSSALTPIEVESPLPPRKRKPRPADVDELPDLAPDLPPAAGNTTSIAPAEQAAPAAPREVAAPVDQGPDLLADLMGRGIAARVRETYREIEAAVAAAAVDDAARARLQARLTAADPDAWATPEAVLAGMGSFEATMDEIRRDVDALEAPPQ